MKKRNLLLHRLGYSFILACNKIGVVMLNGFCGERMK